MNNYLAIFIGGGLGSLCRFALSNYNLNNSGFPAGTLIANALSCLILGFLVAYFLEKEINKSVLLLLTTGFCGGFSTFSTFSLEIFKMLKQNSTMAFIYLAISLFVGLLFIWIGFKLAEKLF